MSAVSLSDFCSRLIERHGSVRNAARVVKVDHAYLYCMAMGTKSRPSESTLRKLGLCPTPLYLPRKP